MYKVQRLIAGLLFGSLVSYSQDTHVSASIPGLKDTKLIIHYYKDTVLATDTVSVKDGKFTWTAKMPEPQKVYIMFPTRYEQFFAESGNIKITGTADLKKFEVQGSKTQDELVAWDKSIKDLTDQEDTLYQKYGKVSKEEQAALETKLHDLKMAKRARADAYIAAHPKSVISTRLVADRAMMGEYRDVYDIYQKLDASAQHSAEGQRIAVRLTVLKKSALGEKILDFTQKDTTGKPVQFASFKGKYVLVDFWASWCGPCRGENPNVLKAYNEYKDKNFTVVGISLDDKAERWEKAIKEDNMPWTQLSDLKGWKNELADFYGIQAIPSNFLVDPNGKIIAKDLRGEALHAKLAELLN
jgi:peroxiredoxin